MEKLKKDIIENLYQLDFYNASLNIKKLEDKINKSDEALFLYYFLYDLMEFLAIHKEDSKVKDIIKNKNRYFNKINKQNKLNKSITYLNLYLFLEENFRKKMEFSWFDKKNKSLNLLNQALSENLNNLEVQFYILFCEGNLNECFNFLNNHKLENKIVERFLNDSKLFYNDKYFDDVENLRKKYKLTTDQYTFTYHTKKKDYQWLYNYFNDNKSEKDKQRSISFGEVCFELGKYRESIDFYTNKQNKNSNDYYKLGECYEKNSKKQKAIECYKNFYINCTARVWKNGIEKLFKLGAYIEIRDILKNENSNDNIVYKMFYESKLLNIDKEYDNSINKLNGILNLLVGSHFQDLKNDVYILYLSNYYKIIILFLEDEYNKILKDKDYELNNTFGLRYDNLSVYENLKKYIKKLNIETNNKYLKATKQCKNRIDRKYFNLHQKLYIEINRTNFKLSEDKELYYLSFFKDNFYFNKRIEIYKKRVKEEIENPYYYLTLGKLFFYKINATDDDYITATIYLKQAIKLAKKYFIFLNGEAELLLIRIKGKNKKEKKDLFDSSMKNYISYNSYQKDVSTMFFNQSFYKYQSFSINTLSSLSEKYLYFASPNKLNDPFDVASETLEKQFDNLKLNKNDFKLCSLSKVNNNKLMWSHYTGEHAGICVGYKFLYLPNYVGKDEVIYKNTRLDEKEIFNNILEYWIVKSEDWEYEKEVRLLHYGDRDKIFYTFDIEEAMNKNIIALEIESITFGSKFKNELVIKPMIEKIEEQQNKRITIYKAIKFNQDLIIEESKVE